MSGSELPDIYMDGSKAIMVEFRKWRCGGEGEGLKAENILYM